MVEILQTHYYDGQWYNLYREMVEEMGKRELLPFLETLEEVNRKDDSLRFVSNLLYQDRVGNYDKVNKVNLEELLPLVWSIVKNKEKDSPEFCLFREQYLDILNGTCPQGRTTRMFQVLLLTR